MGVGRGSPVPSNMMTKEQPLVQIKDEKNVLNLDTVVDDGRDE